MYTLILADDHILIRDGLKLLIESSADFEVIGLAANGQEVLDLLADGLKPDLIVSDMTMPVMNGTELLKSLNDVQSDIKVLIISADERAGTIVEIMKLGAWGYFHKNFELPELLHALRRIAMGSIYLSAEHCLKLLTQDIERTAHLSLSIQPLVLPFFSLMELEILALLGEGMTNRNIADKIFLSSRTIEGYRKILLEKTLSKNTASLIKYAVVNKLIV